MKTVLTKWLLPLIAVAALLLVIAWMAGLFQERVEPGTLAAKTESAILEASFEVTRVDVQASEAVPATVGARQATTISSRIMARITRVLVRAGDSVSQGQLLLDLERSDLESRLSQSKQRVLVAQARLTEASKSLERVSDLQSRGLVAKAALDEARASHDALQAELSSSQRVVEEADVALSYTQIRSPIDGRVVDRLAEPGDTASPGEPLLALYNPLSLRVEASVRESLALALSVGQAVQVEIPALDRRLAAQIEELVPAVNPGSRSFLVKARIEFQDNLMPGMYARLLIPAGTESLLLIPPAFVSRFGQLDVVWIVHNGQAERRFIRLGRSFGPEQVEVTAGLEAGLVIIPRPSD